MGGTDGDAELDGERSEAGTVGRARRGFVLLSAAKGWFLVCSTALNLGLPRLLGSSGRYGDYGVVNTFLSIVNMAVVTGAIQATAKRVGERPEAVAGIRGGVLRAQTLTGGVLCGVLLLGAEPIARWGFGDPGLAPYLRIASAVSLGYAWYASLIGVLNGLGRFGEQAGFDAGFSTLKLALVVGMVLAGLGVGGAFAGFAIAVAAATAVATWRTGRLVGPRDGPPERFPLRTLMLPAMGYLLCLQLLLQLDVLVLKAAARIPVSAALESPAGRAELVRQELIPAGATGAEAVREATSSIAGLFKAVKNVSLIPYEAVIALTFVVFPVLSRALGNRDATMAARWVRQALRFALILVGGSVAALGAAGTPLVGLLFGGPYRVAGPALPPLLAGMGCFALLYVAASLLTAAGRPRHALAIAAAGVAVEVLALWVAARTATPGGPLLAAGAWAVLATMSLAVAASLIAVRRALGTTLPAASAIRVPLATAGALWVARAAGMEGTPAIFVRVGVAAVAFVAAILLSREVTVREIGGLLGRDGGRDA